MPAVQLLLDQGARFAGKTQTDELAFSLMGINAHFPRPVNSARARPRHRRLVLGFGGGGRRRARRHRRRLGHRRLDPRAGKLLRADRAAHDAWPRSRSKARCRLRPRSIRSAGSPTTSRPTRRSAASCSSPIAIAASSRAPVTLARLDALVIGREEADAYDRSREIVIQATREETVRITVPVDHGRTLLVPAQAAGLRGLADPWRVDQGQAAPVRPRHQGALRVRRDRRPRHRPCRGGAPHRASAPNCWTCSARTAFWCCRPCRCRAAEERAAPGDAGLSRAGAAGCYACPACPAFRRSRCRSARCTARRSASRCSGRRTATSR